MGESAGSLLDEGELESVNGGVRSARTIARATRKQWERVVAGGEVWTREEKLFTLCKLRQIASDILARGGPATEEERLAVSACEEGENDLEGTTPVRMDARKEEEEEEEEEEENKREPT